MNQEYDEIISDILIQLHGLDARIGTVEERMKRMESRMDFLIKRMVKVEVRLNKSDKIDDELLSFKQEQQDLNKRFIDYITKKPL